MDRNSARANVFKKRSNRIPAKINGVDIELKPISMKRVFETRQDLQENGEGVAFAKAIIEYAVLPGTDERLFEEGDVEALIGMDYDADMVDLVQKLMKLMGVNTEQAMADEVKNSGETQTN